MANPNSLEYITDYKTAAAVSYQQIISARIYLQKASDNQKGIIENDLSNSLKAIIKRYFEITKQNFKESDINKIEANLMIYIFKNGKDLHPSTLLINFQNLEPGPKNNDISSLYQYFDPLYILSKSKQDYFGCDVIDKFEKASKSFDSGDLSDLEKSSLLYDLYHFCESKLEETIVQTYYSHKTLKRTLENFLKDFRKNLCQKALKESDPIAQNLLGFIILKLLNKTNSYCDKKKYFDEFVNFYNETRQKYLNALNVTIDKNYQLNEGMWINARKEFNRINHILSDINLDLFDQYSDQGNFNYFKVNYYLSNATYYLEKYYFECFENKHSERNSKVISKAVKAIFPTAPTDTVPTKTIPLKTEPPKPNPEVPITAENIITETLSGLTALHERDKKEKPLFYSTHRNCGLHKAFKKTGKSIAYHSAFFAKNKSPKQTKNITEEIPAEDLISNFYKFSKDLNSTWLTWFESLLNKFFNINETEEKTGPRMN